MQNVVVMPGWSKQPAFSLFHVQV